jgi:small-conductance mechanosensitive channel/CRP-like cAMP-binding protein
VLLLIWQDQRDLSFGSLLQPGGVIGKTSPMTILAAWTLMQEGWKLNLGETLVRLGVLAAVYLVFTVAQRLLARHHVFRNAELALNLLALCLLVLLLLGPVLDQMNTQVRVGFRAAAVFLGVAIGLKLFDFVFFDQLARWRQKPPAPLVVRDLGRWGLALVCLVLIVRAFFPEANLNVLAVSSLVVGYIVGNATQDTLGNLFAGLALNAERPFQIGDWVTVGGHTGVVVDTTWRATRLRTKADDYIVIPNSAIGKESIVNFSRPTRNHGCYLTIGVSYDTPPNKAREVILAVLHEAPDVCQEPAPSVYLVNYGNFSIDFKVKFFIEDFARIDPIQSGVMDRLWYAFRREGISIPFPVQEEHYHDMAAEEKAARLAEQEAIRQTLAGAPLFQSLSPEELGRLAGGVKSKDYARGERLCRQGEAGDSFYLIRDGRVGVFMNTPAGPPTKVAELAPGAFFGEMALLTGEPRAATVIAESDVEVLRVSKQDFAGLLQANAELAGQLAAVLEKRLAHNQAAAANATPGGTAPETRSALAARIRRFFGLGSA